MPNPQLDNIKTNKQTSNNANSIKSMRVSMYNKRTKKIRKRN